MYILYLHVFFGTTMPWKILNTACLQNLWENTHATFCTYAIR